MHLFSFFRKKKDVETRSKNVPPVFKAKYYNFTELLESNSELLKIISDIQEKLNGNVVFGMAYVRSQALRAVFHVIRIVRSFEELSGYKNPALMGVTEHIHKEIKQIVERKKEDLTCGYILPYSQITREMVDIVGGKNANLGEIKNHAALPIPNGFAITTAGYESFVRVGDLVEQIRKFEAEADPSDPQSVVSASNNIKQLFLSTPVPDDLEKAILEAHLEMCAANVSLALRSSAIGEDSELSFAGQYLTILNVPPNEIIQSYKLILASLFTPSAISYRLLNGVPLDDMAMSVACLEMVQSKVSGVMYTRHPYIPTEDKILISAVWGLGPYAVDGVVSPDSYTLTKETPPVLVDVKIAPKHVKLIGKPDGYLAEDKVDPELYNRPCLTEDHARTLAEYGLRLEDHFGCPQDIEWALDDCDNLILLQARPLGKQWKDNEKTGTVRQKVPGYPVLLEGGDIACPGFGFGPAFHVRSDEDLMSFPEGGVLVAKHSSPKYVMVLHKAQAVLTDFGSVTGHMASLTREFSVPAILNTKTATTVVKPGEEVTVDACAGLVYKGKVAELLNLSLQKKTFMKGTPIYETLSKLAALIVPLSLIDPTSPSFTPQHAQTVHDIMRLVHEFSYNEMFQIGDLIKDQEWSFLKLDAPIPLDLYIIDLGDGLRDIRTESTKVKVEQISSAPLQALLKGMMHEELRRTKPRPVNLRGFLSVMNEQMFSPPDTGGGGLGDRSYAIISDKYLNFSSRVGYHYSILDTYCGNVTNNNYITFQFKGGAADPVRRNRRARAIASVLEHLDFSVEVTGDRVTARCQKYDAVAIMEKLDKIGRLLQYTGQMDMLMQDEQSIESVAKSFLDGDYNFSG